MSVTVIRERAVIPLKPHVCHGCEGVVVAGDKAHIQVCVFDGRMYSLYHHAECWEVSEFLLRPAPEALFAARHPTWNRYADPDCDGLPPGWLNEWAEDGDIEPDAAKIWEARRRRREQ